MLPILPNQGYGPWAAFNPYHIWLMVVLIAGISYLGYFAIRILGNQHGPVLTGALVDWFLRLPLRLIYQSYQRKIQR